MNYKLCLYLLFILFYVNSFAQNNKILYDFDQLPQTLLLNPGSEVDYNKHFGVPFLSNIYFEIGATNSNITYNKVIAPSNDIEDVIRNIYDQDLDNSDIFLINQRIEFLSAGLRLRNPEYYLSFGMYQEADGFANYPVDVANLYFKGNDQNDDGFPETNENFSFDELNFVGELVGVFHIGLTKNVNDKLTIGARLKVLSGSLSINTENNNADYHLENNFTGFRHNFNDVDISVNSSGLINPDGTRALGGNSEIFSGFFFTGGNFGMGIDLGLTYHFSDKITVTGSVIDLGFVNYSNKITTYEIKKPVILDDDFYFDPTEGSEFTYWKDKLTPYYNNDEIPIDTLQTSYNIGRSTKLNGSIKYRLGNRGKRGNSVFRNVSCDVGSSEDELTNEVGLQIYSNFRPNKLLWAITTFYSREISKNFNTKITYTIDQFSSKNIGLGISSHINNFNFYATADNLLALLKVKDSNYQSFQFGMNFIFN